MRLAAFVEDAAHASFLIGVIKRVAHDVDVEVEVEVRNAVGGKGAALAALKRYVRDLQRGRESFAEILLVAIDGNCQGSQAVVRAITDIAASQDFAGTVVCAVPNPHIELWYLADGRAVHSAIGEDSGQAGLPEQKCERGRYKALLRQAFLDGGIDPPAGGSEYGADIAALLDLTQARRSNQEFDSFVSDLSAALKVN